MFLKTTFIYILSPRFKNFGSNRNSLNTTLRPNLRPNSDDSLCCLIESCKIFGWTEEVRPNINKTDQWRTRGEPSGEALLILHLLPFPFLRPGQVAYLGGAVVLLPPPGKYKIKRKQIQKVTADNDKD